MNLFLLTLLLSLSLHKIMILTTASTTLRMMIDRGGSDADDYDSDFVDNGEEEVKERGSDDGEDSVDDNKFEDVEVDGDEIEK